MRLDRLCGICDDLIDVGLLCPSCMNAMHEAAAREPSLDEIITQAVGETEAVSVEETTK